MPTFYFSYGSEGHPFYGGWTEVDAPDENTACAVFRAVHPDKINGMLNCCAVYSEKEFKRTCLAGPNGNFGRFCHERITLQREVTQN